MAIIIILLLIILSKAHVNSNTLCPEHEKQALLFFKNDLIDSTNRLASWDPNLHQDCCTWVGVVCDNRTGHVISLDLGLPPQDEDTTDYESYEMSKLKGKIKPSLSNLKQLKYLDLSNNSFEGILSYQLGNLSNLEYLNLRDNYGSLYVENLNWLSGLSLLKHLDLSGMNLSRTSNWLQMVNRELPSLEELHLSSCGLVLPGEPSLQHVNLSSLAILDLSEHEKQALLFFKNDLIDPANRLASWDPRHHQDCCRWFGVVCDNMTGNVVSLDLGLPPRDEDTDDQSYEMLKLEGKINPSLSNLKQLRYLDLSNNSFEGILPYQLGNLSNLEYLNLGSDSGYESSSLYAENLNWLSGLSLLKHLDLSWVDLSTASNWLQLVNRELPVLEELHLSFCGLELPGEPSLRHVNLSSLAILDLSLNSFKNQKDLGWLSKLNSLVYLNLEGNRFDGSIPDFLRNMSSLRHLDLSGNGFNTSIPQWLYSFSSLQVLRLNDNKLEGDISSFIANITSLNELDLSWNYELEVKFPKAMGGLCNLKSIGLSNITLSQNISHIFGILSECSSHIFESLWLNNCQLSGQLPDELGHFKNLKQLSLSNNAISGPIPTSLGKLANLEEVYFNNNMLEGVVSEEHFANHTKLEVFHASGNSLVLRVNLNWLPPFQLRELFLRYWQIGPSFPLWLRSQRHLDYLDISNSRISDTIPSWFWRFSTQISLLNLSSNQISGQLLHNFNYGAGIVLDLSLNNFSGPLPVGVSNWSMINLSNNSFSGTLFHFLCYPLNDITTTMVIYLSLANNLLSGEIPDCWVNWLSLNALRLDGNSLSGKIPTSMGSLRDLQSLKLNNNKLHGEISLSLKNCTRLVAINLAKNDLSGSIPGWLGQDLPDLLILILRSNKFRGNIPDHLCARTSLQILDLADNKLFGSIPRCISNFSAMVDNKGSSVNRIYYFGILSPIYEQILDVSEYESVMWKGQFLEYGNTLNLLRLVDLSRNNLSGEIPKEVTSLKGLLSLNLSGNHFTGKIPENIGAMKLLETLDLSQNRLSGSIPGSMATMTFLNHLNLSFNNFNGRIPAGTQLQSFNESCYAGNHLCGAPLKECEGNGKESDVINGAKGTGKGHEINWFYVSMPIGFVTCFWCVMGPLVFNRRWRIIYFRFLDETWWKLCDFVRYLCHFVL